MSLTRAWKITGAFCKAKAHYQIFPAAFRAVKGCFTLIILMDTNQAIGVSEIYLSEAKWILILKSDVIQRGIVSTRPEGPMHVPIKEERRSGRRSRWVDEAPH